MRAGRPEHPERAAGDFRRPQGRSSGNRDQHILSFYLDLINRLFDLGAAAGFYPYRRQIASHATAGDHRPLEQPLGERPSLVRADPIDC